MRAEILSTGDELRSGAIADTNASFIARHLERIGVAVVRHGCVGDDQMMMSQVLAEISRRADFAVVTGGLGPTDDDITAKAAAEAAGVKLVENEAALKMVEGFFKNRHRSLNPMGRKMASVPAGTEIIKNPPGAAPGFILDLNRCRFYFLPGVPHEMESMMLEEVIPDIVSHKDKTTVYYPVRTISSFGIPESEANLRLKGFANRFPDLDLGFQAVFPEVYFKIYGRGPDEKQLEQRMAGAEKWIGDIIGDHILSLAGDSMETVVGKMLQSRKATLSVAESCTGGLISSRLTDVAGSSDYFLFSGVTYANEAKINVLGVSPETLEKQGAVSEETAKQMASGARKIANATYGISTTGIAGPDGGTPEKPVGTVCIGLATPDKVEGYRFHFSFQDRSRNKFMFATKAMDLLRRELL